MQSLLCALTYLCLQSSQVDTSLLCWHIHNPLPFVYQVPSQPPEDNPRAAAMRDMQRQRLKDQEALEASKKTKLREDAAAYLASFYERRQAKKDARLKENRDKMTPAADTPQGDTQWERVISMIDFQFNKYVVDVWGVTCCSRCGAHRTCLTHSTITGLMQTCRGSRAPSTWPRAKTWRQRSEIKLMHQKPYFSSILLQPASLDTQVCNSCTQPHPRSSQTKTDNSVCVIACLRSCLRSRYLSNLLISCCLDLRYDLTNYSKLQHSEHALSTAQQHVMSSSSTPPYLATGVWLPSCAPVTLADFNNETALAFNPASWDFYSSNKSWCVSMQHCT